MRNFKDIIVEKLKVSSNNSEDFEQIWLEIWDSDYMYKRTMWMNATIGYLPESELYGKLYKMQRKNDKGSFVLYMQNTDNTTIHLRYVDKFIEMFGEQTLLDIHKYCMEQK
jgi:hypothetical protein